MLERSNLQREQRIKRVRQKNFRKKEAELSEELSRLSAESLRKRAELEVARRHFINNMSRMVFPIEVESLSERDDGEGERERDKEGEGERGVCALRSIFCAYWYTIIHCVHVLSESVGASRCPLLFVECILNVV